MDGVGRRDDGDRPATVAPDPSGVPVVALAGEIDISCIDAVEAVVQPLLDGTHERLVFDLNAVDFIDSSGLAVLLQAAARVGTVTLRSPSPLLVRILDSNGLLQVLAVET
ncbi:MAG TPA: STAS domain-containing protein [Acidimicrobiia bacterium]|jgi:anti-sigma B factor antagonist